MNDEIERLATIASELQDLCQLTDDLAASRRENAELRERLDRLTSELDKQMRSRDNPDDYVMQY